MDVSYSQLGELVGTQLGPSSYREITQQEIDAFADITDDHYWLHVDRERAAGSPMGGTIAHGFLTLAMISALWPKLLWVTDSPMQMNYGLDRVRFAAPVASGSRIRMQAVITEIIDTADGCRIKVDQTLERENETKPALVATILMQIARPDGSPGHGAPN